MKDNQWIALFSQTGSEIVELSKRLGKFPDVIVTNNGDESTWCKELQELDVHRRSSRIVVVSSIQAKTANFLHNIQGSKNSLVTLHGWLRIIPADICVQYEIVNGHPGLITRYPELKGYDPQIRYWDNKDTYEYYGSVVHNVTAEVDEGKVLTSCERKLEGDHEHPFNLLKDTSLEAWLDFFKTHNTINV